MNIINLPDDVLINLFDKYFCQSDLRALHDTCSRFKIVIDRYNLWLKYLYKVPLIDFNYPFGISNFSQTNEHYQMPNEKRLRLCSKWTSNQYKRKIFYNYNSKMLPHLQIDLSAQNPLLYLTDANQLVKIPLDTIKAYKESKKEYAKLSRLRIFDSNTTTAIKNQIQPIQRYQIFNDDIKSFIKKDNFILSISKKKISMESIISSQMALRLEIEEKGYDNNITCADFTNETNRMVYGCSDGFIKVHDTKEENLFGSLPVAVKNLNDRVLRCVISPSLNYLAVGTAGVKLYTDSTTCPMRIYDFNTLEEVQILKPCSTREYKQGAGILTMSYIDENTIMSSGYDTFIRIFDLRTKKCVQELEEPEDMSIYCACVSGFNGLLTGNSRESMIRYWDRRKNQLVSTYFASSNNSSIYSLACTPEAIYAAWDRGITSIDFS